MTGGAPPDRPRGEVEIRPARPDDVDELVWIWRVAFNDPPDTGSAHAERLRGELDRVLVGADGERILGTARGIPMRQWLGGRPLPAIGVAAVATHPLARGGGVASAVVGHLLREAREEGAVLSCLYPAAVPLYRRLGFEYAGVRTRYRVPLTELPAGSAGDLRQTGPEDLSVRASYRRLAERENGLVEGTEETWWPRRVFDRWPEREARSLAVRTPEPTPEGYAVYALEDLPGGGYRIACTHLVAHSPDGFAGLLHHFRQYRGLGRELVFHGAPTEPLAMLLPEESLAAVRALRFMARILDVPGAFASRGYPADVEGETTIAVRDPLVAANTGRFRLTAGGGHVAAERADGDPGDGPSMTVGALSALFCGYLTPRSAAAAGLVDPADPSLPLLERLLAGPAPWMPDFF